MEQELFQNGQPILTNDLLNSQSSLGDAITKRFTDSFSQGILQGDLNAFAISPNNLTSPPSINVNTGVAYDVFGNRIAITSLSNYATPYQVGSTVRSGNPSTPQGMPNGPATYTNNGIGGYTLTPQVSGSQAVQLVPSEYNYIWLGYLQTTNPSTFVLQNLTNLRLFTSASDGYQIVVVGSPTVVSNPSTLNPDQTNFSYIYLGYVNNTGSPSPLSVGDINTAGLTYYSLENNRLLAETPATDSDRTPVYSYSQSVDLQDHVGAIGTGVMSPENPHAMSLSDLSNVGTTVAQLLATAFTSGITGTDLTSLGYNIDTGDHAGDPAWGVNGFEVKPLLSDSTLYVLGVTMSSTGALGFGAEFYMASASGTILPTDTYTVYVDSVSQSIKMAGAAAGAGQSYQVEVNLILSAGTTTSTPSLTSADFPLWSFAFNHSTGIISSPVDLRMFGNVGSPNLSTDSATNTFDVDHNVDVTGNLNVTGTITGNIVGANNLNGGTAWSIPYQSAPSTTSFTTPAGTTAQVLTAATGGAPSWSNLPLKYYSSVRANGTGITVTVANPTALSWTSQLATTPTYTPGTTFKSVEVYITYSSSILAAPGNGSVFEAYAYPTAGAVNTFTANYPAYGVFLNVNSSYSLSFFASGNATTVDIGFLLVGTV